MNERCRNPGHKAWARYGGAGVTVCDEWTGVDGFARFLEHAGRKPSSAHSIDRIDGSRGYEPGNVRWATATTQSRNRDFAHVIEAFGERLCIAAWSERTGISAGTIIARVNKLGWSGERAVSEPAVIGRNQY